MRLTDWAAITSIAVGCTTVLGVLGQMLIIRPLKAWIKDLTYPIQPTANGGKSLPDVAVTVARIETKIDNVESWLTKVDARFIDHLSHHNDGGSSNA